LNHGLEHGAVQNSSVYSDTMSCTVTLAVRTVYTALATVLDLACKRPRLRFLEAAKSVAFTKQTYARFFGYVSHWQWLVACIASDGSLRSLILQLAGEQRDPFSS